MKIKLHPEKLKPNLDSLGFLVDLFMITLVIANLALILFDWLFQVPPFAQLLANHTPAFHNFYRDTIHADFLFYDLCFVAVYLTEFAVRWAVAIARGTYHRWFFYPFAHWYDLLGCIPVGSFRWLRILRVVNLLFRLQRMGIIDLSQTWLGQTLIKYYNILVEEISDRVVLQVLSGAQREVGGGSPLLHRIEKDVLAPRQEKLVAFVAERIAAATRKTHSEYRDELAGYFAHLTDEAITRTPAGKRLAAIPVAGPRAIALVGDAVRETGSAFVDQLVEDLSSQANRAQLEQLFHDVLDASRGDGEQLDELLRDTLLDILEQIKQQVAVQRWKLEEQAQDPDNKY
ncbi:MAG: ion transporter [Pseudomonadota bacterium]|uniref:ion transporter n=1 Tax=Alcanivorax sp. TaxID=1872427 RepID=UPI00243F290D|nr:ion transporter [Alcanivorax sp.]MED5239238.1 ion transporter [Pseudomonadota bacterium]MEE3321889.1 ion transporter [Pseudomonadota bacterium]